MTILGRAVESILRLPPPRTRTVAVHRAVAVPMRDGAVLRADHYAPSLPAAPTVLVRTPYGRGGPMGLAARSVAERGFHVLLQSCRGTADSGGSFEPMRNERADGLDTLDWLRGQRWYTGTLCLFGASYVGYTQWAIAAEAGPELAAVASLITASDFRDSTYAGGSFSLDAVLTWAALLNAQDGPRLPNLVELLRGQPRLRRGLAHLPLGEADLVATGAEIAFVREWLEHTEPDDEYWRERSHRSRRTEVTAPVLMIGGAYDIFLPWQIDDFVALRDAGRRPHLTIGPWTHGSVGLYREAVRETVDWFRAHTYGDPSDLRRYPVRVYLGGAGRWLEEPDWPPAGSTGEWFLRGAAGLGPEPSAEQGEPDRFTYDPTDPTPAVGGPRLAANVAGRRDNRELEARPDVLCYTSAPLDADLEVVGPVSATVLLAASGPYFDVFVRLCEVTPDGRSWNLCDGLVRVSPGAFPTGSDGVHRVTVPMWPCAHLFRPGHRLRVQISGGAHPRFARNTGTGEPLGHGTALRPVDISVHPDRSVLHLPLVDRPAG